MEWQYDWSGRNLIIHRANGGCFYTFDTVLILTAISGWQKTAEFVQLIRVSSGQSLVLCLGVLHLVLNCFADMWAILSQIPTLLSGAETYFN
jgi:hypothetical protein